MEAGEGRRNRMGITSRTHKAVLYERVRGRRNCWYLEFGK
jgi:hypothetical protein